MYDDIERLSRRRRILMMVMASSFLVWRIPAMDFFSVASQSGQSIANILATIGFLVWAGALVVLLRTGRGLNRTTTPELGAALEDELVKSNRSKAWMVGYVVALSTASLIFAISLFQTVTGTDAAHLILVATVVAPMYTFAFLERINA